MAAAGTISARTPSSGRDAGWLVSADLLAVGLAFLGQILLTHALLAEHYGWMVLAIDLYASIFLVIDLGLPTLLARDGSHAPHMVRPAVGRIYRWQFMVSMPFIALAFFIQPQSLIDLTAASTLLFIAACIALVHVAAYAPRSGLRAIGEARFEALSKLLERLLTVLGYAVLYIGGSTNVEAYALVFLLGATVGTGSSLLFLGRITRTMNGMDAWSELDPVWSNSRTLLWTALPFAITLGVLPYVIRIEKFIVAGTAGAQAAAVFHVAQLAWLAGLVVPSAMRAALLPVLGANRHHPYLRRNDMDTSLSMCFGLLPIGLFGGALIVKFLAPVAFPDEYLDGTHGASAVTLFNILLFGWACTLLATPTYTALMAGNRPWKFTQFILIVVLCAVLLGWLLIGILPESDMGRLHAASIASSLSAFFLLVTSWSMSDHFSSIWRRRDEWALAGLGTCFVVLGLVSQTGWWVLGLPLFTFLPQGWRAARSTLS